MDKLQKQQGIIDAWYVDADPRGADDKWIHEAVRGVDTAGWPDGFAPGELAEGIIFHHSDGRRAKIKRKDYPRSRRAPNRAAASRSYSEV